MDLTNKARALLDGMKAPAPITGVGENLMPPSTRIELDTSNGPIGVWRAGTGPAILFVHGWEDTHRTWRRFVQTCLAQDLAVVLMDLPGHGVSAQARYSTYPFAADAVLQVAECAGPIWAAAAHSFGCIATSCALKRGLDVEVAALIAPPIPSAATSWIAKRRMEGTDEAVLAAAQEIYHAETGHTLEPFALADALRAWNGDLFIAASMIDEKTPLVPIQGLASELPNAKLDDSFRSDHRELTNDGDVIDEVLKFLIGTPPA